MEPETDPEGSRITPERPNEMVTMSIQDLKTYIRSPDHFAWIFGIELCYHLPPRQFMTWPFISAILEGKKKLLKVSQFNLSYKLPCIKELSMKRIWPYFVNNADIIQYMPILSEGRFPPRRFFYQILQAIRPGDFKNLLQEVDRIRQTEETTKLQRLSVKKDIMEELKNEKYYITIPSKRISKKIITKPVKRKR